FIDGYAGRIHDEWTLSRLEAGRATSFAASTTAGAFGLLRHLGQSEIGMLRAFEIAKRLPIGQAEYRIGRVLRRFPPTPKLAVALVDLALHALKRNAAISSNSHPHLALDVLPRWLEDVTGALDLLDAVEPAWAFVARKRRECRDCVRTAWETSALAVERA